MEKEKYNEYMREYYHNNKEKAKSLMKKYAQANPEKIKAIKQKYKKTHVMELRARKKANKFMKLKNKCEICGDNNNLQFHHWRYDKPRLVNTLCGYCHGVQHSRRLK